MTDNNISIEEIRQRLHSDFKTLLYVVWSHLNLPEPTEIQLDIADYIQYSPKRSIIQAFRGVGKSYITSTYVIWCLLRNPNTKILVVSASKERADSFSIFVKKLISEIPILKHLKPRNDQRDSNISFDVGNCSPDHSPSVKSIGITGQLTGSRADIIVADDIETPANSATQVMRDKISELVKEFDSILKPLPESKIIYLGTPQQELSLYNQLADTRGYECRIWTSLFPTKDKVGHYKSYLAPYIQNKLELDITLANKPTDPKRFNQEDLDERLLSYGKSGFALQFQLDTTLSDADKYPLKISDLIVFDLDKELAPIKFAWGKSTPRNDISNLALTGDRYYSPIFYSEKEMSSYQGSVMAIDPSGRGSDETGFACVKQLSGNLFLTDAGGLSDGSGYSDNVMIKLAETAKRNSVNYILIESNFGDGMFAKLLQPFLQRIHPCTVEEIRSSQRKELRIIETLEPIMNGHRLIVDSKVLQRDFETSVSKDTRYSLIYQMTRLTKDKGAIVHDDRLDALAIACQYWLTSMAQDKDKAVDRIRHKVLDSELQDFINHQMIAKSHLISSLRHEQGSPVLDQARLYPKRSWLRQSRHSNLIKF